jgi:hypothetical protein
MRSRRLVAATGAIYVVAVVVGNVLATDTGNGGTGDRAVLDNLRHRTTGQAIGLVLEVLSFVALLLFLGYLYRVLRRAERPDGWAAAAAFGVGLVSTAVKLGSAAPALAAYLRRDDLTPELARTLDDLNGGAFVVSGLSFGLFVALASCSAAGSRALPRWLSISGLVVGVLTVAAGTAGVLDPAGYVPVPFLLCAVWVLVTSVLLAGRREEPADRADTAVPAGVAAPA